MEKSRGLGRHVFSNVRTHPCCMYTVSREPGRFPEAGGKQFGLHTVFHLDAPKEQREWPCPNKQGCIYHHWCRVGQVTSEGLQMPLEPLDSSLLNLSQILPWWHWPHLPTDWTLGTWPNLWGTNEHSGIIQMFVGTAQCPSSQPSSHPFHADWVPTMRPGDSQEGMDECLSSVDFIFSRKYTISGWMTDIANGELSPLNVRWFLMLHEKYLFFCF